MPDRLRRARTYVVIQLLQHSLVQLDDKGAGIAVLQDSDLCSGPFSGHLVQGHLNTGLLACYLRDLQAAYHLQRKDICLTCHFKALCQTMSCCHTSV